jgi:hypothetical protein
MKKKILAALEFILWCFCVLGVLFAIEFDCPAFILLAIIGFCAAFIINAMRKEESELQVIEEKQDMLMFILNTLKKYYGVAPYRLGKYEYSFRNKRFLINEKLICFQALGVEKHLKPDITEQELFKWLDDCENLLK